MPLCPENAGCCGECCNWLSNLKWSIRVVLTAASLMQFVLCGLAFLTPFNWAALPIALCTCFGLVAVFFKWRWGLYVYAVICAVLLVLYTIPFILNITSAKYTAVDFIYNVGMIVEIIIITFCIVLIIRKDLNNDNIKNAAATGKSALDTKRKLDKAGVDTTGLLVDAGKAAARSV